MTPDPAQLQAWVDEIIPHVTFPATSGPVRRPRPSRGDATGRPHRDAAAATPLAGHARRGLRGGGHRRATTSCSSWRPRPSRRPWRRRAGPTGSACRSPRRTSGWWPASCDRVEADAAAIGAVNSVARTPAGELVGFNTDAPGFQAAVELALGRPLAGLDVVVAGAGGAAHAVVFACLRAGAARVTIGNRTLATATELAGAARATRVRGPSPRRPWTSQPSPPRSERRTWRSTRPRSAWWTPG